MEIESNRRQSTAVALALGQFDGVHLGHRAVCEAVCRARDAWPGGGEVRALTFEPHVLAVLRGAAPAPLCGVEERCRRLRECGADAVDVWPFDRALAALPPDAFWARLLRAYPGLRAVATGSNFTFGAGGSGNVATLRALAAASGVVVATAPDALWRGAPVSSSRIREAVLSGDVAAAAAMLGRPHVLRGEVVHGRAVGRTRGLPTLNVRPGEGFPPAPGVYAVRVAFSDGSRRFGAAFAPDGNDPRQALYRSPLEVHVLDFSRDAYGERVAVEFAARIRPFIRFDTEADAIRQIQLDISEVRHECEIFPWNPAQNA